MNYADDAAIIAALEARQRMAQRLRDGLEPQSNDHQSCDHANDYCACTITNTFSG